MTIKQILDGKKMDDGKILQAVENSMLKAINKGEAINFPYDSKINGGILVQGAFNSIDKERLKKAITEELEKQIAVSVVNKIAAEISTDIKNLLSNKTIRDDVVYYVRKKLEETIEPITK